MQSQRNYYIFTCPMRILPITCHVPQIMIIIKTAIILDTGKYAELLQSENFGNLTWIHAKKFNGQCQNNGHA